MKVRVALRYYAHCVHCFKCAPPLYLYGVIFIVIMGVLLMLGRV